MILDSGLLCWPLRILSN